MKLIRYFILSILSIVIFYIPSVSAAIKDIDMDIYIDSDGTAHIKEVWEVEIYQGTEGYKPYSDLGISKILNFTVTDDTGYTYESLNNWNTNATFIEKSYKSGINITKDGLELCFGISKYGDRTYTLTYDITDFVIQYTDTQGIYFTFIDMNQYIGHAKVSIYSDIPFSIKDNIKIWGFGHNGTTTIEDGKVVIETSSPMNSSQYVSTLLRFESNQFYTNKLSNKSFDEVYDDAFEAYEKLKDDKSGYLLIGGAIIVLILIANPYTWLILLGLIAYLIIRDDNTVYDGGKLLKNIDMFREIPCDKDIFYAYFLARKYSISTESTIRTGLIGGLLLKWFKNSNINIKEGNKEFSFKDNNYVVDFNKFKKPDDQLEEELYRILESAAGKNRILEKKEFENWCKYNYDRINSWFNKIDKVVTKRLYSKGLIYAVDEKKGRFFKRARKVDEEHYSLSLKEEAMRLAGLKKFLLDTSIDEKKFIEVHLWDEYLMFAELLGIADKVSEQFSKLYPEFKNSLSDYNYVASTVIAADIYRNYSIGYNRATARSYASGGGNYIGHSSYSGGGGSSFSSGGHSSSGSHGGGFR